jgi:predicted Na+-dependent transporter
VSNWGKPVRKIAAAAIAAVVAAPALTAWLANGGDLDWRSLIAVVLAAVVPVAVGYLPHSEAVPPGGDPID